MIYLNHKTGTILTRLGCDVLWGSATLTEANGQNTDTNQPRSTDGSQTAAMFARCGFLFFSFPPFHFLTLPHII